VQVWSAAGRRELFLGKAFCGNQRHRWQGRHAPGRNTAKLNDLDPQTYLADVPERMISGQTPVNWLEELLA
jgi:hypothetical protein